MYHLAIFDFIPSIKKKINNNLIKLKPCSCTQCVFKELYRRMDGRIKTTQKKDV